MIPGTMITPIGPNIPIVDIPTINPPPFPIYFLVALAYVTTTATSPTSLLEFQVFQTGFFDQKVS